MFVDRKPNSHAVLNAVFGPSPAHVHTTLLNAEVAAMTIEGI